MVPGRRKFWREKAVAGKVAPNLRQVLCKKGIETVTEKAPHHIFMVIIDIASSDRKVANLYIPHRPEKLYRMLYFYAFVHCAPGRERAG
jgi:hypothetical protein